MVRFLSTTTTAEPWKPSRLFDHRRLVITDDGLGGFGTIHFGNTAGIAGLPADYSFNSTDAGVHSFTVTLSTVGTQTISIADLASPALTTSVVVTVKTAGGGGGGSGSGGGGKV